VQVQHLLDQQDNGVVCGDALDRGTYAPCRGDAVPTGTITLRNRFVTLPLGVSRPASTKVRRRSSFVRVRSQAEVFFHASAMSKLGGRFALTDEKMV